MFEIYADDYKLWESNDDNLKLMEPKVSLELNKVGSCSFKISPEHIYYEKIVQMETIISVYQDYRLIFRGRVYSDEMDFRKIRTITAEGTLAYLNDSIVRTYAYAGTVRGYFEFLISQHNDQVEEFQQFKVGEVTVTDSNDYIVRSSTQLPTTWEEITQKCIEEAGGYINLRYEEDGNYLDWLEDYDDVSTQDIAFSVNLLDIDLDADASDLATCIIPRGAMIESEDPDVTEYVDITSVNDGKDYICDEESVKKYGMICEVVSWDDVTLPENLLTKAQQYLKDKVKLMTQITIKAADLHLSDDAIQSFAIGQYINVYSVPHQIDETILLTQYDMNLADPANSEITLNIEKESYVRNRNTVIGDMFRNITNETTNIINQNISGIEERVTQYVVAVIADYGYITEADIGTLRAQVATIAESYLGYAEAEELYARKATVDVLDASVADIISLLSGNVTAGAITSIVLNSENVTIADATIKSAMIDSIEANKITSGSINTSNVTITSDDGGILISGSTQQFIDENGNVRVQIGMDEEGNFTFILYDETGEGILIDSEGIHASAVPDGLIVNSMVAEDAAIAGSKLDIDSVIVEINGSSTTISSSQIYFSDEEQTLDVAFKNMTTTVDEMSESIESNTTAIEVIDGKIETLITDTSQLYEQVENVSEGLITAQGTITELENSYSSIQQTVDSYDSIISAQDVKITEMEGTIEGVSEAMGSLETDVNASLKGFQDTLDVTVTEVNDSISVIEQTVDGITATVEEDHSKIESLTGDDGVFMSDYVTQETMSSTIEQTSSSILMEVSETYMTKDEWKNVKTLVEVVAWYLASNSNKEPIEGGLLVNSEDSFLVDSYGRILLTGNGEWTTTVPSTSYRRPYLWYYLEFIYDDGTSTTTDPAILETYQDLFEVDEWGNIVYEYDENGNLVPKLKYTTNQQFLESTTIIESRMATFEQNLDGFILDVQENYYTRQDLIGQNGVLSEYVTYTSMESTIQQTSDEILLEVSKTYVEMNEYANEIDNVYSQIKQNADEIELKVDSSGIIAAINMSSESVTISASKLNINGAISANGNFEVTTAGNLTCTGGTIAGWSINSSAIYRNSSTWGNSSGMYFGTNGLSLGSAFTVDSSGALKATSGTIGGWSISSGSIYRTSSTYGDSSGMYFGSNGLSIKDVFRVSSSGKMTCTDATISSSNSSNVTAEIASGRFNVYYDSSSVTGYFSGYCTYNNTGEHGVRIGGYGLISLVTPYFGIGDYVAPGVTSTLSMGQTGTMTYVKSITVSSGSVTNWTTSTIYFTKGLMTTSFS